MNWIGEIRVVVVRVVSCVELIEERREDTHADGAERGRGEREAIIP